MQKAISPLLAVVILAAFTISIAVLATGSLTSIIKSQTTGMESYRGCTGAIIDVSVVKCSPSSFDSSGDTSLVGYWKMDSVNGTNYTKDFSGYGNDGLLTNMNNTGNATSGPTIGKIGNALQFDGVNDYVDAGNASSLNITDAITIEAWIKPNVLLGRQGLVSKRNSNAPTPYIFTTNGNALDYGYYGIDEAWHFSISSNTGITTDWQHIAVTYQSGNVSYYRNGIPFGTGVYTSSPKGNSLPIYIGNDPGYLYFNGTIDEVRIYNRSLSADEILAQYNHHKLSMVVSNPSSMNLTGISMLNVMDNKQYVNSTNVSIGTGESKIMDTNTSRGDVSLLRVSASNCPVYSQLTNETVLIARCD